jgi:hypothetical protein
MVDGMATGLEPAVGLCPRTHRPDISASPTSSVGSEGLLEVSTLLEESAWGIQPVAGLEWLT